MDPVDSDLEEGEILDDSPSSSYISDKKDRELPRRYIVHEKSNSCHKHKKVCKYDVHYHAKKLPKLKKTPKSKVVYKKHHKSSCPREKFNKLSVKSSTNLEKNFSKKGHYLIAEIKGSSKERNIKKQRCLSKFEKNLSETENIKTSNDNLSMSAISRRKADFQPENKRSFIDSKQKHYNQPLVNSSNDLLNLGKVNTDSDLKMSNNVVSDSSLKVKNEESEDEEELRRIALATCAKRKADMDSSENLMQTVDNFIASIPELSEIDNAHISNHEISSPASDNYEVMDMEVDDDSSIEILENSVKNQNTDYMENLFIIDTKPSKENIKENTLPELQTINSSDDDFETDILRAELIESLYRKKCQEECVEEQKPNVDIHQKQAPILPEKKHIGNFKKSNVNFYRKQLRPGKQVLRKNIVKSGKLHCIVKKQTSPLPIQVNQPSERLIIALNEESSSDDSVDSVPENPVASIEALISDCRQKSESSEKTKEAVTGVPKEVSCLSKAQQEEYTLLKKMLAEKERLHGPSDTFQHTNGSAHSPLNDLKLLEGKMIQCKETLKKEKEMMAILSKEINSKKLLYMKSKLSAEHLKEQYIAAEKIRKANLCTWSKSLSGIKGKKKTVSNLENKITQLQILCSKVGASIQGQTYNLPSLPTGNRES